MPENIFSNAGTRTDGMQRPEAFRSFEATELYCPRCRRAVPVRQRLLLILPEGEMYEYRCAVCAESVGTKIDKVSGPQLMPF